MPVSPVKSAHSATELAEVISQVVKAIADAHSMATDLTKQYAEDPHPTLRAAAVKAIDLLAEVKTYQQDPSGTTEFPVKALTQLSAIHHFASYVAASRHMMFAGNSDHPLLRPAFQALERAIKGDEAGLRGMPASTTSNPVLTVMAAVGALLAIAVLAYAICA